MILTHKRPSGILICYSEDLAHDQKGLVQAELDNLNSTTHVSDPLGDEPIRIGRSTVPLPPQDSFDHNLSQIEAEFRQRSAAHVARRRCRATSASGPTSSTPVDSLNRSASGDRTYHLDELRTSRCYDSIESVLGKSVGVNTVFSGPLPFSIDPTAN